MSATTELPSITKFWPNVEQNLTQIKWKHAVNSKKLLDEALQSEVHMIEADVSYDPVAKKPIMAHPPAVTSDLTLEEFLKKVKDNGKKGIKLDFKSFDAFNTSVEVLQKTEINVPVWLNADILKGPTADGTEPVDKMKFLNLAKTILHGSTLSLGWTTKNGTSTSTDAKYNKEHIDEMLKTVNSNIMNKNQSVTYAMRAGLLALTSLDDVQLLAKNSENSTITVWSSQNDTVDATKLSEMIKSIGLNKVFVDVPADLEAKLQLNGSANLRTASLGVMSSILFCFMATKIISG